MCCKLCNLSCAKLQRPFSGSAVSEPILLPACTFRAAGPGVSLQKSRPEGPRGERPASLGMAWKCPWCRGFSCCGVSLWQTSSHWCLSYRDPHSKKLQDLQPSSKGSPERWDSFYSFSLENFDGDLLLYLLRYVEAMTVLTCTCTTSELWLKWLAGLWKPRQNSFKLRTCAR